VPDGPLDALGLAPYRLASFAAQYLPETVTSLGAGALGLGFAQVQRDQRDIVARNLQRVKGPQLRGPALRQAVQRSFDSYARYWVESFRIPSLSWAEIDAGFSIEGFAAIDDALGRGKGCILALPHLGGWEWAGRWLAEQGFAVTVVVEPLEPPEVFEWFVSFRRSLGMNVVALGPDVVTVVSKALRENHIVCLLCDRDIQGGGVDVEFFRERTTLPAGPVLLALRNDSVVVPAAVYFTSQRNGHLGYVRPPLPLERRGTLRDDLQRITQLLAHELELLIRRAPEQWHLFQPNWPSDPGYGV
jgi:phosphatidylinositol dimannoside acyltransferase